MHCAFRNTRASSTKSQRIVPSIWGFFAVSANGDELTESASIASVKLRGLAKSRIVDAMALRARRWREPPQKQPFLVSRSLADHGIPLL